MQYFVILKTRLHEFSADFYQKHGLNDYHCFLKATIMKYDGLRISEAFKCNNVNDVVMSCALSCMCSVGFLLFWSYCDVGKMREEYELLWHRKLHVLRVFFFYLKTDVCYVFYILLWCRFYQTKIAFFNQALAKWYKITKIRLRQDNYRTLDVKTSYWRLTSQRTLTSILDIKHTSYFTVSWLRIKKIDRVCYVVYWM